MGCSGRVQPATAPQHYSQPTAAQLPGPAPLAIYQPPPATSPSSDGGSAPPTPSTHSRCGWIGGGDTVGEASFAAHAAEFNTVHPKWYTLAADGLTPTRLSHADIAVVVDAARAQNVRIMPLIDADDVTRLRAFLPDPVKRAQHVQNLTDLVTAGGYAGLDIDYEHLWTSSDRAPFTAFMQELAQAFHAHGLELSMAIPALSVDNGNNGYDYAALSAAVDTIHIMGYDFHFIGGAHLGPLAPLGWIQDSLALAESTGHADHFMIGVANYAIGNGWYTSARDAMATQCVATPAPTTTHMQTCSYGDFDAGRSMHCLTATQGELWFEDVASMEEKVVAAVAHGARGVTYWTIGDELDGYFDMARKYFP